MEQQKILFADLFRLLDSIREEVKLTGKSVGSLLYEADWDKVSMTVNGITTEADLIRRMCNAMVQNCEQFLQNGPYVYQSVGATPMEGLAMEMTKAVMDV